jgi:inner membrane protease subunit 1
MKKLALFASPTFFVPFLRSIKWGVCAFGIFFLVDRHISIGVGRGMSMWPTFADGDIFLKEGLTWRYFKRPFRVGDVIVYRSPFNRSERVIKRIVALQGDVVMKDETFEFDIPPRGYVVPYGQIWVEGDNRQFSRDSRSYGPISINLVEYRVIARVH